MSARFKSATCSFFRCTRQNSANRPSSCALTFTVLATWLFSAQHWSIYFSMASAIRTRPSRQGLAGLSSAPCVATACSAPGLRAEALSPNRAFSPQRSLCSSVTFPTHASCRRRRNAARTLCCLRNRFLGDRSCGTRLSRGCTAILSCSLGFSPVLRRGAKPLFRRNTVWRGKSGVSVAR